MKKRMSLLLAVCMLLALAMPVSAEELSGECGMDATWAFDSATGTLTISGSGDLYDYYISSTVPWYRYTNAITSLVIGDGITGIGMNAFGLCAKLTQVHIPASVSRIGELAFFGCSGIAAFSVDQDSAWFCADEAGVLLSKDKTRLIQAPRKIGNYALPDSVATIDPYAFYLCSGLTAVTLPQGLKVIGTGAFSGCSRLMAVEIPAAVTEIGESAFQNCGSLTAIEVASGNSAYSSDESGVLFDKKKTTLIQAPGGLSGSYCVPTTVTSIGDNAFIWCEELEEVMLPEGLTAIGEGAFSGCYYLRSINLPACITAIEKNTFYDCAYLESIVIPAGVETIGANAFALCMELQEITFLGDAPSIHQSAFSDVLADAYYPAGNTTWTAAKQANYGGDLTWKESALFSLAGANVNLGNDLTMNFYVNVSDIQGDDYYIEIVKEYANRASVTTTVPFSEWKSYYGVMWTVSLEGMAAKEMADTIYVTVYNGDGAVASNTWTDSIRDYCIRQLNNPGQSDAYTLLADMLNYGAAAQTQFHYNTGDLANSTMTPQQAAYATSDFSLSDYSNNQVKGENYIGSSLSLETNIVLSVYFNKITATYIKGLTAKVTYTDHLGVVHSREIAEKDFADLAGAYYGIVIDTLVAADVSQMVSVELYDGKTLVGSASDSMESYAVRQGGDINIALMKFTLSAREYLC